MGRKGHGVNRHLFIQELIICGAMSDPMQTIREICISLKLGADERLTRRMHGMGCRRSVRHAHRQGYAPPCTHTPVDTAHCELSVHTCKHTS